MWSSRAGLTGPGRQLRPPRVGLLVCGEVHEALRPEFGSYARCLARRLQLEREGVLVRTWQAWKGELPGSALEADAYLISGSPASVYDREPWIDQLGEFVRETWHAQRRLAGICFGHQMIHQALGGRVERASGWGLGAYPVQLRQPLAGLPGSRPLAIHAMHRDQVVTPAAGFELLAGSRFCPYYLMRHSHRILTIQGHPEFTRDFFYRFLEVAEARFDRQAVLRARRDMPCADDSNAVCGLLNHFLLGSRHFRRETCTR